MGILTAQITWAGFRRINWKDSLTYIVAFWIFFPCAVAVHHYYDLYLLYLILPTSIELKWVAPLIDVPFGERYKVAAIFVAWFTLIILGVKAFFQRNRYQKALDRVSLKNGMGAGPKLISLRQEGAHHFVLKIRSEGVGKDRFVENKDNLESAFAAPIDKIRTADNPQYIEIALAKRRLPLVCHYRDLINRAVKPYTFVIGETATGPLIESIQKLRHIIIAGTTGGGKSIFFKQLILGLIHTSNHLQVYLIDLKKGVEVREFGQLPNVAIAKNEVEALAMLRELKAEMERRFIHMESKGLKMIDPDRDKMDRIVIGVDEASVLYAKPNRKEDGTALIDEARDLTETLGKLARSASIHLILATQKVIKDTIDTRVQENVNGRMCFRVNTYHGSHNVLNNGMAYDLPDHPGRAIWNAGNEYVEVQAPFISDEEIQQECDRIKAEFENGKRSIYHKMLSIEGPAKDDPAKVAAVRRGSH